MSNVYQVAQGDPTITKLLEIVAGIRAGHIVGVSVVTTAKDGRVELATLSVPAHCDRRIA